MPSILKVQWVMTPWLVWLYKIMTTITNMLELVIKHNQLCRSAKLMNYLGHYVLWGSTHQQPQMCKILLRFENVKQL